MGARSISEFFNSFWDTQLGYDSDEVLDQLDWDDFIRIVSTMNIKTCGTKIEARILKRNAWEKIHGQALHGDGRDASGRIIEIKSSIISPRKGSNVTFRGIRPWANVDIHCFILADLRLYKDKPKTMTFMLSKEQLLHELEVEKTLRPYNKKKADRGLDEKTELGTAFKKSDLFRWTQSYSAKINL